MMCSASALVRGGMAKWRPAAATPLLHARGMADGGQDIGKQTSLVKSERANPLDSPDFFGVGGLFTVADLFRARVHLGHTYRAVDPRMRQFLFGRRFDTAVFDLDQTALHLRQALNFLAHLASRGGVVLFVARQPHLTHLIERAAKECGEYAHCRKWRSQTFTASHATFGGEVRLPDAIVLLHTREGLKYDPHPAVIDAAKAGIPTVAVVDSDCNPNIISYPVPGNDDTPQAIQLYLSLFTRAIALGKRHRSRRQRTAPSDTKDEEEGQQQQSQQEEKGASQT